MAITLTPEQEEQVRQDATLCGFETVETYLADRLNHVHELELNFQEHHEELRTLVQEGLDEADRGELLTPEESKAQFELMKRDFLANRSAA